MEKKEDAVLGMDIYRLERNGAREIAGSQHFHNHSFFFI
jgi:hypothetical protein